MTTRDYRKAECFKMYAYECEGMIYSIKQIKGATYELVAKDDYDPQVEQAVWRNFNQEWRIASKRDRIIYFALY